MREKYDNLYQDIHLNRNSWTKYYSTFWLYRRFAVAFIPLIFINQVMLQIALVMMISTIWILYYCTARPHMDSRRSRIEVFNEAMIMVFIYHMILYTDYCSNFRLQFYVGYSGMFILFAIVAINIILLLSKIMQKAQRRNRLRLNRKAYLKQLKESQLAKDDELKTKSMKKEKFVAYKTFIRNKFSKEIVNAYYE